MMCGYGKGSYRVAYREGEPCPVCGAVIEKVKTGSTSSYICPRCQPLLGLQYYVEVTQRHILLSKNYIY
jgi:hypothetical protein